MDYEKIYNQLIERARSENRQKGCGIYFERHHAIPKCLGGSNDKINLVLLTAREHFLAHKLLCEIYPNHAKLKYALWAMINLNNSNQSRLYKITSREYQLARTNYIQLVKKPKSEEHRLKLKQSWTNERRQQESSRKLGKKIKYKNGVSPLKGTKKPKELILCGELHYNFGKNLSSETKTKIKNTLTGRIHSDVTKQKMKDSANNKPYIECPHCSMKSKSGGNMNRYHFTNCKYKGDN
jgi:hypothetical protein